MDASLSDVFLYEHRGYKTTGHGILELENDVKLVYEIMEKKIERLIVTELLKLSISGLTKKWHIIKEPDAEPIISAMENGSAFIWYYFMHQVVVRLFGIKIYCFCANILVSMQ